MSLAGRAFAHVDFKPFDFKCSRYRNVKIYEIITFQSKTYKRHGFSKSDLKKYLLVKAKNLELIFRMFNVLIEHPCLLIYICDLNLTFPQKKMFKNM